MFALTPTYLPRFRPLARGPILRWIYHRLQSRWGRSEGEPVRVKMHGVEVLLNRGNPYPFFVADYPMFNAPLVELAHQLARRKGPITLVDVGAAVGDTVLLVRARCPEAVGKFICVEGDREFATLLRGNMAQFSNVTVVHSLLARERTAARALVKHHKGTAMAVGEDLVDALPLDDLDAVQNANVDLLKIDCDGFDGEVLAGAAATMRRCKPAVIFEWHPSLAVATGNNPFSAFEVLRDLGFTQLAWFNNIGTFSHFSEIPSLDVNEHMSKYLQQQSTQTGEHYDIVAAHPDSTLDLVSLASLNVARHAAKSSRIP